MRDRLSWRIRIYEFLAAPAHAWLHVCAALVGIRLMFGPIKSMRMDGQADDRRGGPE
jgi:hypothetical protein